MPKLQKIVAGKKNTANLKKEWVSGVSNFTAEKIKYDTFGNVLVLC